MDQVKDQVTKLGERVDDLDSNKADLSGEITVFGEPPVEGVYHIVNFEAAMMGAQGPCSEEETHTAWELL